MKLSASMLRVLRACAAGEVRLTPPPKRWSGVCWSSVWADAGGRSVDRQVAALQRRGLLARSTVTLTDAGRAELGWCHLCGQVITTNHLRRYVGAEDVWKDEHFKGECPAPEAKP